MDFFPPESCQEKKIKNKRKILVTLGREKPKLIWMSDPKMQKANHFMHESSRHILETNF